MNWRDRAACRDADPELFFPTRTREDGVPARVHTAAPAKQVCGSCPVTTECARYAILTRQHYGVWGGMTQEELTEMRRSRHAV